jgi:hypothetical protein
MDKRCKLCGETKPVEDFYRAAGARDGHRGDCKACNLARKANWYQRNRESEIARVLEWQAANPERVKASRRKRNAARRSEIREATLVRKYGITQGDYEMLLATQGGTCAICRRRPAQGTSLHVDHDHETGAVRGLLCFRCNGGGGQFGEDEERLLVAAGYFAKHDELHEIARSRALALRAA